jgi:hypothetical protein
VCIFILEQLDCMHGHCISFVCAGYLGKAKANWGDLPNYLLNIDGVFYGAGHMGLRILDTFVCLSYFILH